MSEVLYHKTYPKPDDTEELAADEEIEEMPAGPRLTFDEMMEKIQKDTYYVLLPNKMRCADLFVKEAIRISEWYELDLKVTKYDFNIVAEFYLNCGVVLYEHQRLMLLADSFEIFNNIEGHDILLRLEYNTHAVIRRSRQIYPFGG